MFQGYRQETLDFLWGIRFNNDRTWFQAHKEEYLRCLYEPTAALGGGGLRPLRLQAAQAGAGPPHFPDLPGRPGGSTAGVPTRTTCGSPCGRSGTRGPTGRSSGSRWLRRGGATAWAAGTPRPPPWPPCGGDIDGGGKEIARLARRLARQEVFSLQGQDYARPKGEPGPLLAPWYNKKSLSIGCDRPFDDLVCSPELVDTLVEGFEFLLPYYMYFDSLCKTGLEDLK